MGVSACPSASRLLALALGELEGKEKMGLEAHVDPCPSCEPQLNTLKRAASARDADEIMAAPEYLASVHLPTDMAAARAAVGSIKCGDILLVESGDKTLRRLVLALDSLDQSQSFTACLLSREIERATERDAILSEQQSPLCYPILVEATDSFPLPAAQCLEYLGSIDEALVKDLRRLSGISGLPQGSPISVGEPLVSPDDPRVEFQLQEAEVAQALSADYFATAFEEDDLPDSDGVARSLT